MDRGEPTLVPQWLKNNGSNGTGGGSGRQPYFSSSSRSDRSAPKHARGASSANIGITASDRTGATHFHRHSSGSSSHLQSYRGFSRSNQNGVRKDSLELHDKEKLNVCVHRDGNHFDDFDGGLRGKFQKDKLQRSQSMNGHEEDLRVTPNVGRVRSPGFQRQATAFSEGWTSALAVAPGVSANGSLSSLAYSQITSGVSASIPQCMLATNKAEAVSQTPTRVCTPPEVSVETQRLEELAVKLSKQLIPMTPTMPRSPTTSSLERSKTRVLQQQAKLSSSLCGGQAVRVTTPRLDTVKLSYPSKLQILKPLKDLNGVSISGKESCFSANGASVPASPLSVASSTCGSPGGNSFSHRNIASFDRKPTVVPANVEKRPSMQAQSRNDFFKLLKKKSFTGISPSSDGGHSLSTVLDKSDFSGNDSVSSDEKQEVLPDASDSDMLHENDVKVGVSNRDVYEVTRQRTLNGEVRSFYSVEEEAAFLRSLGWEESAGEEEGLTEEEISAFFQECSKLGLSPKSLSARKMELQLTANQRSCIGSSCGRSSSSPHSDS